MQNDTHLFNEYFFGMNSIRKERLSKRECKRVVELLTLQKNYSVPRVHVEKGMKLGLHLYREEKRWISKEAFFERVLHYDQSACHQALLRIIAMVENLRTALYIVH